MASIEFKIIMFALPDRTYIISESRLVNICRQFEVFETTYRTP